MSDKPCCCTSAGTTQIAAARYTTSEITLSESWDHFLARWGVKRYAHVVEPGLYALGSPRRDSPVFVTANYTLSFDSLRSSLRGTDGFILVLDTKGINVWCAAGKGTFGTDELVRRIDSTPLREATAGRTLILPQLGATGVSAHEVKKRSGFRVEYGPVRARDLPEYLKTHTATPEMRRVRFGLADRITLVPVELVHVLIPMLLAAAVVLGVFGPIASGAVLASVLAGGVLFPVLLPWLPTPNFSSKGLLLGMLVALPFAVASAGTPPGAAAWRQASEALVYLLIMPPVTAYLALNFTGSTTFTSKTGVRKEIFAYVPVMAWMLGIGVVLGIVLAILRR